MSYRVHESSTTGARVAMAALLLAAGAVPAAAACEQTDARVRRLVEKLASQNHAPAEWDGTPTRYQPLPADYKQAAQEVVFDAADEILKIGEAAIPELLRHTQDTRYSVTERSGPGATHNYDVGHECERLVRRMLSAGVVPLWGWRGSPTDFTADELHAWWKKNGHRPLWELQLERLERFMRGVRADLKPAAPERDFAPSKERLVQILAAAEASAEKLRKTHEPIPIAYPRGAMVTPKHQ